MSEQESQAGQITEPKYAGFWLRFCACISDGILLGIPLAILEVVWNPYGAVEQNVTIAMQSDASPLAAFSGFFDSNVIGYMIVSTLVYIAYYVYFHASVWQATPGKMLFGIKVAGADFGRISHLRAFGRYLASWISALILGIGFIMAAFHPKKRALHDLIADTYVLDTASRRRWGVFIVLILLYIVMAYIKPTPGGDALNSQGYSNEYSDPQGSEEDPMKVDQ